MTNPGDAGGLACEWIRQRHRQVHTSNAEEVMGQRSRPIHIGIVIDEAGDGLGVSGQGGQALARAPDLEEPERADSLHQAALGVSPAQLP
jgi:hypothetical protein